MPHDAKGNILKAGDRVNIPATVIQVYACEDFCNCEVEIDAPMPGYADKTHCRISALNTRQVELAPPEQPSES